MNEKILRDQIMALLANQDDSAALESVYALLKPHFEKVKGAKCQKQLVLTEWQRECIDRAIGEHLVERLPDGKLRWRQSLVLLAYFCGRVFSGDYTRTDSVDGKGYWKPGREPFPAAALERLFHTTALKQSRHRRLWLLLPEDHELVDKILLF